MNKFDLIPYPENIKTIFILESPYEEELNYGFPCAGKSMSFKILNDNCIPFGKLLFEKDERIKEFGVFNSSPFPFEIHDDLSEIQEEIAFLKTIEKQEGHFYSHTPYFEHLKTIENLDDELNYSNRLLTILEKSPSIENIVICGFIAQSIYNFILEQPLPKYGKLEKIQTSSGRNLFQLICNHPSNNPWDFELRKLNK